jgi:hypothetical protein
MSSEQTRQKGDSQHGYFRHQLIAVLWAIEVWSQESLSERKEGGGATTTTGKESGESHDATLRQVGCGLCRRRRAVFGPNSSCVYR